MDSSLNPLSHLLNLLFFHGIGPFFSFVGRGLEWLVLRPLELLQLPPAVQVMVVAALTAALSSGVRRLLGSAKKDEAFRRRFAARKAEQQDLQLISDWKSRETFAKAIDDDIDLDFNTYLAERFARYGLTYLLPIFFTLFWLDHALGTAAASIVLPSNPLGISVISAPTIFLLFYCLALLLFSRLQKKDKPNLIDAHR